MKLWIGYFCKEEPIESATGVDVNCDELPILSALYLLRASIFPKEHLADLLPIRTLENRQLKLSTRNALINCCLVFDTDDWKNFSPRSVIRIMAVFANPSLLLVMYLVTYAGGSGRRLKRRHTETKEVCEPWGTQEGDERYCYIQSFGMLGLGYTRMISEKLDVLHILCPEIVFTITVVGIEEIEYRGEAYEVKIEDPLKDFHKQAFESRCVDTFKALQTMILGKGVSVSSGPMRLCEEIMNKLCSIYNQATEGFTTSQLRYS